MTYSLLAGGLKSAKTLSTIAICALAVILLIAFIIGLTRGWRKVSWAGVTWAVGAGVYLLVEKTLGRKLGIVLGAKLATKVSAKFPTPAVDLVPTLISLAIAILLTLLAHGIMTAVFRPHYKEVVGDGEHLDMDEQGIVYDEDVQDYDDYECYRSRKSVIRKGFGTPTFLGRFFGGLLAIINVVVFVGVVACLALLIIQPTKLGVGKLASVYKWKFMPKLMTFCGKYLWDCILVGACIAIVRKGVQTGAAETLRVLIVKVGGFAGVVASFVIPFTKLAKKGILAKLVTKCVGLTTKLGGTFGPIAGKLLAGLVVCALFIVVIVILNLLLKGWVSVVDDIGFFRAVDGFIATTLYIAIAVAICLAIFAVFALLAKYNVWNIGKLIPENSLVSELFDTARAYVDPIMRKVTGLLSKLKK